MSGGARTSGRQRATVEYNEAAAYKGAKSAGAGPAWARELGAKPGSQGSKENSRPLSAPAPPAKSGAQARKPAVAQKGRDAGLERLPIEDAKGAKPSGKACGGDALAVAAGKQVLPGVFVKGGPPGAAKADAKAGSGSGKAAAAQKPAAPLAKPGGGSGSGKAAAAVPKPAAPPAKSTAGSSGRGGDAAASGKRKAAAPPAEAKPVAGAASGSDGKRQKAAPAAAPPELQAPRAARGDQAAAPARPAAPAAAAAAAAEEAVLAAPNGSAEELAVQSSGNFRALQAEFNMLQAQYEDLKAAKIDEEVQQLLEQQNRYVSEHGQKAAELVERYKREAQHHADTAAQLGGEALVEQCDRLQADLMNCQQALLDKEAESLEKDKQLAEMAARLAFLERYARVYDACDKCIQTDDLPGEDASAQFPSLQSSGMEMLQAHAMVPEGAGGGSIYRRPKAANGPQLPDTSYTLPARTALAAGAAAGEAATAAGGVPVSGSDMELTGEAAAQEQVAQMQAQAQVQDQGLQTEPEEPRQQQPQQQQQQQARRQSLQPAAGRVAHAAGGPGLRPASAESQVQPQVVLAAQQQVQRQAAARRMTIAPVPAGAGTAGGARRVSAPPAPTDRELHFTSVSTTEGHGHLAVVPEDQPFGSEQDRAGSAAQQQPQQHRPQEEEPPFEFPQPPAPAPAPSQLTAPTAPAAARGGAPTPGSMPPRELAITALTGLVATPIRGGFYRYADQASGYIFELGPAPPDSADLGAAGESCLCYRPIALGGMAPLLPEHFHEEVCFVESQRSNFFRQVMHCLAQHH